MSSTPENSTDLFQIVSTSSEHAPSISVDQYILPDNLVNTEDQRIILIKNKYTSDQILQCDRNNSIIENENNDRTEMFSKTNIDKLLDEICPQYKENHIKRPLALYRKSAGDVLFIQRFDSETSYFREKV